MSEAGDRLRQRFTSLQVRVEVPEWAGIIPEDENGDPVLYASPFTLREYKRLARWLHADDDEGFAQVVIMKACDESGERIFDIGDLGALMECSEGSVVKRVGMALMASVTPEQAEQD